MKPQSSILAALAFSCLWTAARAEAPAGAPPAAGAETLGMTETEIKDFCSYVKDVVYEQFKAAPAGQAPWKNACEPVNAQALAALKASDPAFGQYQAAVAPRKQTVLGVYRRATAEFKDVKDDSDRKQSSSVNDVMTLEYDGKQYTGTIAPPINERTFSAWLSPEQVKQVFPLWVVARDEQLRLEKSGVLKEVPRDAEQRKAFCAGGGNEAACRRFEQVQRQLEENKVRLYQMKDIKDPNQFSQFIGEGWQRSDDGIINAGVAAGPGGARRDDSALPVEPSQRLKTGGVPQPYVFGSLDKVQKTGNTVGFGGVQIDTGIFKMGLGLGAGLMGMGLYGALRGSRKEIAAEDAADMRPAPEAAASAPEPAAAPTGSPYGDLSPGEAAFLDRSISYWKTSDAHEIQSFTDWFGTDDCTHGLGVAPANSPEYRSLLAKIRGGKLKNLP